MCNFLHTSEVFNKNFYIPLFYIYACDVMSGRSHHIYSNIDVIGIKKMQENWLTNSNHQVCV